MAKILIPTPLRQFTGKQDSVTVPGATVGEVLTALTAQFPDLRKQIFTDEGKLRSFINVYLNDEDIRYMGKDTAATADGDTLSLVPSIAGGTRRPIDAFERRNSPLFAPPDRAGSGHGRPVEVEGRQSPAGGHRRARRTARPVPGRRGRRQDRPGGFRRGRFHQPAAPGDSLHQGRGPQEDRFGRRRRCWRSIRNVEIVKHEVALTSENALEIIKDYDMVVDGTDNFPTRYLVNDACVLLNKPNVYGSIFRFEGQATVFAYRGRPLLSLPLSGTATSRPGPELRRGRRAGHSARHHRPDPGDRSREADSRNRRAAGRTPDAVRCARHALPRAEAAQESRVPDLRRSPDNHAS